jgi:hypothetical protein
MHQILVFLHLFGLMLGAAGGFASGLIMRRAAALPADEARVLRSLGPMLANVSLVGLGVMWLTGLILIFTVWGGLSALPGMFWVKMVFVLALTALALATHYTYGQVAAGNAAAAARLPRLGPLSGISSLLAVLFAAFAFVP